MTADDEFAPFIEGFGVAGYRSFGHDIQWINPLKKINVFIGRNNSGKSNVLRLVHERLRSLCDRCHSTGRSRDQSPPPIAANEVYGREGTLNARFGLALNIKSKHFDDIRAKVTKPIYDQDLEAIIQLISRDQFAHLVFDWKNDSGAIELNQEFVSHNFDQLGTLLKGSDSVFRLQNMIRENPVAGANPDHRVYLAALLEALVPTFALPQAQLIPNIRDALFKGGGAPDNVWNGSNLIGRLASLQNPGGFHITSDAIRNDRLKFNRIRDFFRRLVGKPSANLEINYDRDTILVDMDERVFPLEALGTGISQSILIAAAVTLSEPTLVCIEEPEIHMHPTLQRALIEFLDQSTKNQYFISTHSASLIDYPNASVFGVEWNDNIGSSKISFRLSDHHLYETCFDLGYRPSDLLQSNCVIWVEGPSDRIYLRSWISKVDPGLKEEVHYSFIMYGGSLATHLSLTDSGLDISDQEESSTETDYIQVARLNRRLVFITDSDQRPEKVIGRKVKERLQSEVATNQTVSIQFHTTAGVTIENYIPASIAQKHLTSILGEDCELADFTKEQNWWIGDCKRQVTQKADGKKTMQSIRGAAKVKLAHAVTEDASYWSDWNVMNLESTIQEIAKFIREANRLGVI